MYDEDSVLCGASAYTRQFYFNPRYESIPGSVRDELEIICVSFTEDVGGTLVLRFDDKDGSLLFETSADDDDFFYDDIGGGLKISRLRRERADLLESLEMFYRIFFMADGEEL